MDNLYIDMRGDRVALDPAVIKKYNVRAGTLSPFSRCPVVDARGRMPPRQPEPAARLDEQPPGERLDGIAQLDMGLELKTSEIIDFAQGADSNIDSE